MRKAVAAVAGLLVLPLLSGGVSAQGEERYRLERTEDGYVRMDTQTGAMTLCQERDSELVCRPASEGSAGSDSDVEALRSRIAALEERVGTLEEGSGDSRLPLEQEFEQSLGLMERFFRRFVDIVRGLEEEQREETPESRPPASGERT